MILWCVARWESQSETDRQTKTEILVQSKTEGACIKARQTGKIIVTATGNGETAKEGEIGWDWEWLTRCD